MRTATLLSSVVFTFGLLASCGGPPESARLAQHHLAKGQFDAADRAADVTLEKHPKDPTAWRVKIRVAMGKGEFSNAAKLYSEWKTLRGSHDKTAYQMMAKANLWQGLRVPATDIQTKAIQIVERHQVESLADEVRELLSSDSDLVAAAAAAALVTSHPAAPDLAIELLQSDDARARLLIVRSIGIKVGRIARSDIFPSLQDSDARVRRAAVAAIRSWKSKKDRQRLILIAQKDSDGQVRSGALRALVPIGGEGVVKLALSKLSDPYLGARLSAVALLDKHGSAEIEPQLRQILSGEDLSLALRAAVALYKRSPWNASSLLQRAYASDSASIRVAALNATVALTDKAKALTLGKIALNDSAASVQLAAARMLYGLGLQEPALATMRISLNDDSLAIRLQAAADLARYGDAAGVAALSRFASAGSAEDREASVLAHRGASQITDGLVAALSDVNISVRLAAADVLLSL